MLGISLVEWDSQSPIPSTPKSNSIYLACKNFQPKNKKENQILPATIEKIKILTVYGSFRQITKGKYKTRAIQTDFGTFRHNQTYPGIIQAHLEPCVTLTYLKLWYIWNPDIFRTRTIFRTLTYSQPWYIQNPDIFTTLVYSEPCYIQNAGIFKIRGIFRTQTNIYDKAFRENS